MNIDTRTIVRASKYVAAVGVICGALVAVVAFARPYMASDDPPFANVNRVSTEDLKLNQLAQSFSTMQRTQQSMYQSQLFLARGFWQDQVIAAQLEVRRQPNSMLARQQLMRAEAELDTINKQILNGGR